MSILDNEFIFDKFSLRFVVSRDDLEFFFFGIEIDVIVVLVYWVNDVFFICF